ncbi:hypothetical protein NDU88_005089 [Pleurodeles waltl]|uniref:Reverse transcriptase domain-containing protein n=1 Tax=Pleurodeles waltl TaxID=8319 RepID=A0AAV7LN55_PLEWA|nr:hypothetical protein NDU88_005089 [Pleurodeles waltl]
MPKNGKDLAPCTYRIQPHHPQDCHLQTSPADPHHQKNLLQKPHRNQRSQQQRALRHHQRTLQPQALLLQTPAITGALQLPCHLLPSKHRRYPQQLQTPDPPANHRQPRTNAPSNVNPLCAWTHVNNEDTINTMASIHSGSPSDPYPHQIFNKAINIITPHLCAIINSSFETATFPESWKQADVNALFKKPKADPDDPKNYRPVSLLPFPVKVIKKIMNSQLSRFLEDSKALDTSQSGFRKNHSTETALIAATDDIRTMLDEGETAALILLYLSTAFKTVCHHTLRTRLHNDGICGKALEWISSFLSGRTQRVRHPPYLSESSKTICGVPQGSSLSPTLFNVYMAPLTNIARSYHINIVSYADDTQLIISLTKDPTRARNNLHNGLHAIANWMESSCLKLNTDKTEILIFGSNPSAWKDSWWPTSLGAAPTPTTQVRNLGIILDSALSMTQQVNAVSSSCYNTLRMPRKIFKWIPIETRKTVTHYLVSSQLDYGNALYAGTTAKLQTKMQHIQNASARLILDVPRRNHISAHLRDLHWLPYRRGLPSNYSPTHTKPSSTQVRPTSMTDSPFILPSTSSAPPASPSPPSPAFAAPQPGEDPSLTSPPRSGTPYHSTYTRSRTS